jgi:hypothetical protein
MSRTVERARCLLARPGAWLGAEQGVYALRLGPDRRGRISLTLSEPEFRALIERPGLPFLGTGEASQGPKGAALANAVMDATGVRFREVPFVPSRIKAGLV